MAYPDMTEVLSAEPLQHWIDQVFLRPDPFAFGEGSGVFREISLLASEQFGLDPNGIFCVGSGAVGYSINPNKMVEGELKGFGRGSDIDLVLISEVHFEQSWRHLRKAAEPTLDEIPNDLVENLAWQKRRFFDGAILAAVLLPHLPFGDEWVTSKLAVDQAIASAIGWEIDVKAWIYRDYWSVRNRIAASIVECRAKAGQHG